MYNPFTYARKFGPATIHVHVVDPRFVIVFSMRDESFSHRKTEGNVNFLLSPTVVKSLQAGLYGIYTQ